MRIKLLFIISCAVSINFLNAQYSAWRIQLLAHLTPDTYYAGCWGWYDPIKNREYAISGAHKGTYFVDITNPTSAYIADSLIGIPINVWREVKTYKNFCYIISDDYGPSFQIVDLSPLPDSVRVIASPDTGILSKGHTLWVSDHYLYVGGPRDKFGNNHPMGVFDLLPDPEHPKFLRWLDQDYPNISYVHDMYVRHDTVFASAAYQGLQVFRYDSVQNKFVYINSLINYLEAGYNHSNALTENGKILVFMDEVPSGLSFKVADVSNVNNIQVLSYVRPYNYGGFVAHNPFIVGNRNLIASCYQDGTLIYDISNPSNPVLTGFFDTYPQYGANTGVYNPSEAYQGNWGSYPFFPSGLIFSNDMTNGIFILKADTALNVSEYTSSQDIDVNIFPNPVNDIVNVYFNIDGIANLLIEDIAGKFLWRKENVYVTHHQPYQIDLSNYSNGLYFLHLQINNRNITLKVFKN
ncbi:MAG: choice-of-anchor B family protein [Bacteroidia bacterium]|nr:choice-of-anchor B family protein [Bacteroidia bacterium]